MSDEGAAPEAESPGALLRAARLEAELDSREVAQQLNWLPGYVDIVERDDYLALRSPAFARGYVKAYGKLMGVNELRLRHAFDALQQGRQLELQQRSAPRSPLHLQRTGKGILVGLTTLGLLVAALWWQGNRDVAPHSAAGGGAAEATQLSVGE